MNLPTTLFNHLIRLPRHFKSGIGARFPKILAPSLVAVLLCIGANGATFTVTKVADTNDGVCDADCSLREAVVAANAAVTTDEIEFDTSVFNTPQTITLGGSLSITGPGTAIHGTGVSLLTISISNPSRAFIVSVVDTAISGVKINGGGIAVITGGALALSNSRIENAAGNTEGGGVSAIEASLTVTNCVIENNQAGNGGGVHTRQGTVTVTNSIINNNRVGDFLGGGGVYNFKGTITIVGSTISNNQNTNTSFGAGGGIANYGAMEIIDSTVTGNLTHLAGGGIVNESNVGVPNTGVLTITRSTISSNVSNAGLGAGINNRGGTLTISASTINNNIAATGSGGGIAIRDFAGDNASLVTITNSTISSNTTPADGAGIYHFASSGVVDLLNNTIVFNVSDADNNGSGLGGGITNVSGLVRFRNTLIANNSAPFSKDISGSFTSQGFNLIEVTSGGSISGTLTGNVTGLDPQLLPFANYGGQTKTYGLQLTSPALDKADPNNFPPTDQRGVTRPQDGDGNGTVLPDIGSVESQINSLTVTKVADTNDGVCNADCSLREAIQTINGGTNGLVNFDATVFATPQTILLTLGELAVTNSGTLIVNGTGRNQLTISGNNQGRIFAISAGSSAMISRLAMVNGNGVGSVSTGSGGAIFVAEGSLSLNDVAVSGNVASGNGGGLFIDLGTVTITNSSINNNAANSGGGVYNGGTLGIIGSTVSANTALLGGGGIVNTRGMTITNATISGNSTNGPFGGGGIFNNSGVTTTISYATIASNTGFPGAGVRNNGGLMNLRCTLLGDNLDGAGMNSDFSGTLSSQGFNLVESISGTTITGTTTGNITGQDPNLGPLADNGGLTLTHLPNVGSPAVDKADPGFFPATDQRGVSRPRDGDANGSLVPDIGAVEILTPPLVPLTLAVDRTDDANIGTCTTAPNDCTLRGAISRANAVGSNDTIVFDSSVFGTGRVIVLTSGSSTLTVANSGTLTINGTGAKMLSIVGSNSGRVFVIDTGAIVTISGLSISNGNGGIHNAGTLSLTNVRVSANNSTTGAGGGIANLGALVLSKVTVSNNSSTVGAGGIYSDVSGNVMVTNSTVSGNTAPFDGGIGNFGLLTLRSVTVTANSMTTPDVNFAGGVNAASTTTVENSIISGNTSAAGTSADIHGAFSSQGYNLIGNTAGGTGFSAALNDILNPAGGAGLAALGDNGGDTQTHALLANSPALDKGKSFGVTTDQRGSIRPDDNPGVPNAPGGDGADIGAFELHQSLRAPFDFDGDGKTDIGIFRPVGAASEWWINRSSTGVTFALQFGASTDRITPADYTGDGKADIAFFRPASGEWYVLRSEDFSFFALPFGTNGDIPAPADYDADGKADFAVFRPSSATWFISQSSGAPTQIVQFGINGDQPVVADYDGDAKADIGIFRNNNGVAEWWINRSIAGLLAMQFGASTDKAVQGDYTGDGKADIAIWRPASGEWLIVRSEDFSFFGFPFGTNGDIVSPGDYDGDGKFDATVFRPSNATWFIARTTAGTQIVQFGATGDRPIPNAFVP